MLAEGRFTRRLWPVDLSNTATRNTANPQGQVQSDRASGNHLYLNLRCLAQLHNCTLAEATLNLSKSKVDGLLTLSHACISGTPVYWGFFFLRHNQYLQGVRASLDCPPPQPCIPPSFHRLRKAVVIKMIS